MSLCIIILTPYLTWHYITTIIYTVILCGTVDNHVTTSPEFVPWTAEIFNGVSGWQGKLRVNRLDSM